MRHDLSEVLRDPLRFMAEKAGHMLGNPRAIPARTLDYAKYDLVRVFNKLLDALGLHESMVESVLSRAIAMPASRFLRMKRSVSLLVSDRTVPAAARSSKAPTRAPSSSSGTAASAAPVARRHADPFRLTHSGTGHLGTFALAPCLCTLERAPWHPGTSRRDV